VCRLIQICACTVQTHQACGSCLLAGQVCVRFGFFLSVRRLFIADRGILNRVSTTAPCVLVDLYYVCASSVKHGHAATLFTFECLPIFSLQELFPEIHFLFMELF
jgi:hypothetical protein